jgi:hypothetical protein
MMGLNEVRIFQPASVYREYVSQTANLGKRTFTILTVLSFAQESFTGYSTPFDVGLLKSEMA